jgi:hypothetical protein
MCGIKGRAKPGAQGFGTTRLASMHACGDGRGPPCGAQPAPVPLTPVADGQAIVVVPHRRAIVSRPMRAVKGRRGAELQHWALFSVSMGLDEGQELPERACKGERCPKATLLAQKCSREARGLMRGMRVHF